MIGEIKKGQLQKKPLGMYLVEAGLITPIQVDMALHEQKVSGKRLGQILSDWGFVEQQTIEYLIEKVVLPERRVFEKQLCDSEKNGYLKLTTVVSANQAQRGESDSLRLLASPSRQLEVSFSPRRALRFLLLIVFSLALTSLIGQFSVYYLPDYFFRDTVAKLTNIDIEQTIPAFYSSSALLLCSILLAIITYTKKLAGESYVRHWGALSIIFLYLSLDEALSIHELIILPLRSALNASGFFYFTWIIPGAIFVLICLLVFLRFLTHLPVKIRRLFLIAGTIYVAGAIGMEMVDGYYADLYGQDNITYNILSTIEEFFEMLGIVVFIYALLSYMSQHVQRLQINIINNQKQRRITLLQ